MAKISYRDHVEVARYQPADRAWTLVMTHGTVRPYYRILYKPSGSGGQYKVEASAHSEEFAMRIWMSRTGQGSGRL